jgi:hypothetical protein
MVDVVDSATSQEGARRMTPVARSWQVDGEVDGRADWEVPAWSARLRVRAPSPLAGTCTVLVVDDRSDRRTSWCHTADFLRFAGYSVCEAAGAQDAGRFLAHMRFDVVVRDEGPPDTGALHVGDANGTCSVLEKPVQPEELVRAVGRVASEAVE